MSENLAQVILFNRYKRSVSTGNSEISGASPQNGGLYFHERHSNCLRRQIMSLPFSQTPNATPRLNSAPPANRILVVDDEFINRELLARLLNRNGYVATQASGAEEALDWISRETFDLVLLDVVMPSMSGLECLKLIRQKFSVSDLPVIMVTGEQDRERVLEAFRSGANDYINKPIDREILLIRIATHTALRASLLALKYSEERYSLAARGSNDGLWDWDLVRNEVFFSARWKAMLGYADHEIGHSPSEWLKRIHTEDIPKFEQAFLSRADGLRSTEKNSQCEIRMIHRDGTYRWMICRGVHVHDSDGCVIRMAGSLTDITEGKVGDALTGLPNRLLFLDRLSRVIERFQRNPQSKFAVIFMDLDNFKTINDSLGHEAGDELLITLSNRLKSCLRGTDSVSRASDATVARHAGDEFTILVEDIVDLDDVEVIVKRMLEEISKPLVLKGQMITPSASVGWTTSRDEKFSPEDLLHEADLAMYQAKSNGRNSACRYTPSLKQQSAKRLELESELRKALAHREFILFYQPVVENQTREIIGFESLVRWNNPHRGIILPVDFIATAQQMGLIVPLGWQLFEIAAKQAKQWTVDFPDRELTLSINFSIKQLYQPDFAEQFKRSVSESGINPNRLCVELTESILMENPELVSELLREMRGLGVKISVDDFGTGYSSLAYLHRFPLDIVKIDRSFVGSMLHDPESLQIVKTIIELGRHLKLRVIAEGVENQEQLKILQELGCLYSQGYIWSKPIDVEGANQLLLSNQPAPPGPICPDDWPPVNIAATLITDVP